MNDTPPEQKTGRYRPLGKELQQTTETIEAIIDAVDLILEGVPMCVAVTATVNALLISLFHNTNSVEVIRGCRKGINAALDKMESFLEDAHKN